ncbi:MAG: GTPase [Deltaproteobacteria bacterium]|nr:GTPase [Deltaproteobacteria bacterium]
MKKKAIIMGAAGRDFHNFNTYFRHNEDYEITAFTATQIPFISNRTYPPSLSGPLYPDGIPIHPEEELAGLIKSQNIDEVIFSYSDVSHDYVMHRASLVTALGADFVLLGFEKTMLKSSKPVISVCAVRTGCGKSGVTRYIGKLLKELGRKPVAIRHPMPYGDLEKQAVQRFSKPQDLTEANCTIEEMEEYEPLINAGITVYAGVDYEKILRRAEQEAEIIIWDGGNNDLPFIRPDLSLVVADPLRTGHELSYYHGEANLRRADCVIINKANSAKCDDIEQLKKNIRSVNTTAQIILTASSVDVEEPIKGKRVLVIEDGPTLTHGGMDYGAGIIAARLYGAEPVDASPYAVGTIKDTLSRYPHIKNLLPAMGYSPTQMRELEESINRTPCDMVLIATPIDLAKLINIKKPFTRVHYGIAEIETPGLKGVITQFLKRTA